MKKKQESKERKIDPFDLEEILIELPEIQSKQFDQGGFHLVALIITELKSHMTCLKIRVLSLVEILFVKKKSFTRFALQSECCNFNQ